MLTGVESYVQLSTVCNGEDESKPSFKKSSDYAI